MRQRLTTKNRGVYTNARGATTYSKALDGGMRGGTTNSGHKALDGGVSINRLVDHDR